MKKDRRRPALHAASMAGGVAAAFLAIALMRGDAFSFSTPDPPEGYTVAHSGGYTVYAPSAQALREGVEEVREARATFRARFGTEPAGLVVVLADSPAALRAMDLKPLRRRGVPLLPFVTRAHLAAAPTGEDEVFALDGGALLKQVDGTTRVVAAGNGAAHRAGLRAGDRVVGVNGSAGSALDSIARRFEAVPVGGAVRLDVLRGGAPARVEYARGVRDTAAAQARQRAAAQFRVEGKTLGHEVCHQLVAGVADRAARRDAPTRGYGHPALPDWFDEMAATLCEGDAARERRRAYLRANPDLRIPLAEFARMDHPVRVAVSVQGAGSMPRPSADGDVQVVRGEAARQLLRNMNAGLFYAQALSLGEFIHERGGAPALRTLAERLAAGRTLDQALAEAKRAAPSVPGSVAELEAEWLRSLAPAQ
ncbi:MAG: hypothetical protein KY467_00585 [Gemmatimonadetes bacterium]|nr:hypothetical protein [Gemmatimonadota bacterium]